MAYMQVLKQVRILAFIFDKLFKVFSPDDLSNVFDNFYMETLEHLFNPIALTAALDIKMAKLLACQVPSDNTILSPLNVFDLGSEMLSKAICADVEIEDFLDYIYIFNLSGRESYNVQAIIDSYLSKGKFSLIVFKLEYALPFKEHPEASIPPHIFIKNRAKTECLSLFIDSRFIGDRGVPSVCLVYAKEAHASVWFSSKLDILFRQRFSALLSACLAVLQLLRLILFLILSFTNDAFRSLLLNGPKHSRWTRNLLSLKLIILTAVYFWVFSARRSSVRLIGILYSCFAVVNPLILLGAFCTYRYVNFYRILSIAFNFGMASFLLFAHRLHPYLFPNYYIPHFDDTKDAVKIRSAQQSHQSVIVGTDRNTSNKSKVT